MATTTRDLNVSLIFLIGAISVLLLFVIVVSTQAWYRWEVNREVERKVTNQPFNNLDELNAQQEQRLSGYQRNEQAGNTVRIPLDRAMSLTAQRYQQDPAMGQSPAPASRQQSDSGGGSGGDGGNGGGGDSAGSSGDSGSGSNGGSGAGESGGSQPAAENQPENGSDSGSAGNGGSQSGDRPSGDQPEAGSDNSANGGNEAGGNAANAGGSDNAANGQAPAESSGSGDQSSEPNQSESAQ